MMKAPEIYDNDTNDFKQIDLRKSVGVTMLNEILNHN